MNNSNSKDFIDSIEAFFDSEEWAWVSVIFEIALTLLLCWLAYKILSKISRTVFKRLEKKQKGLHISFFRKFVNIIIAIGVIVLGISAFAGADNVWKTALGGTSIVIAVLTFAAQDVIKDILAGIMISIYKPFDIGDRIELENGTAGIIEDITLRHVVIITVGTLRQIIPNSKINSMSIVNCSYGLNCRSLLMKFSIGYDSDVDLAKQLIEKVVEDSPLTIPGKKKPDGTMIYSPAFFNEFADSALIIGVIVYYKAVPTEKIKDSINSEVRAAFNENGIEIPYNYINVIAPNHR